MKARLHSRRRSWFAACLAVLLATFTGAAAADPAVDAAQAFTAAYEAWDTNGFAVAEALAQAAVAAQPRSVAAQYWKAVIQFHQVLAVLGGGELKGAARDEADARMAEALASLDRVVALDPRHAEGWALRGTLAGIRIGLHPATAVWRGPRVLHDNRRALELGAANPRVRYLLGTSAFFGPSVLGGKSRALEHFLAAGPLYERERAAPAGALEPRWGQASCLTFAARCYQEAGRPAEAEACVARALTVHPQARAMLDALQATGQAAGAGDREAGVREPGAGEVPDE